MSNHLKVPVHLWDQEKTIQGTLILRPDMLVFELVDFGQSHLDMKIPLRDIIRVESFLIFGHARKGLKITSKDERVDLFVLDDPLSFRKQLLLAIEAI